MLVLAKSKKVTCLACSGMKIALSMFKTEMSVYQSKA